MSTEETIQFYLITFSIMLTPIIIYSIVKFISYRKEKERTRIENELCAQQNTDKANRTVKYLMEKTIGKELTVIVFNFDWSCLWTGEIERKIMFDKKYKTELYKKYSDNFNMVSVKQFDTCEKILEKKFSKNSYVQNYNFIMHKLCQTASEYYKLKEQLKEYENN